MKSKAQNLASQNHIALNNLFEHYPCSQILKNFRHNLPIMKQNMPKNQYQQFLADALLFAAKYNSYNLVDFLLNEKANPNYIVNDECALTIALSYCNQDIVKLLISKGANPNIQSAFQTAKDTKNPTIIDILITSPKFNPLQIDNDDPLLGSIKAEYNAAKYKASEFNNVLQNCTKHG